MGRTFGNGEIGKDSTDTLTAKIRYAGTAKSRGRDEDAKESIHPFGFPYLLRASDFATLRSPRSGVLLA